MLERYQVKLQIRSCQKDRKWPIHILYLVSVKMYAGQKYFTVIKEVDDTLDVSIENCAAVCVSHQMMICWRYSRPHFIHKIS